MKPIAVVSAVVVLLGLGACSEKPQTAGTRKSDQAPFTTAAGSYTAAGWKAGDQVSWERQLATRTANGQNEYSRTGDH